MTKLSGGNFPLMPWIALPPFVIFRQGGGVSMNKVAHCSSHFCCLPFKSALFCREIYLSFRSSTLMGKGGNGNTAMEAFPLIPWLMLAVFQKTTSNRLLDEGY
jgi:hypothetical protein